MMIVNRKNAPPINILTDGTSIEDAHLDHLNMLQATVAPKKSYRDAMHLGPNYTPQKFDVICARGKKSFTHYGNRFFRQLVEQFTDQYAKTTSKAQRSGIVRDIVDRVRSLGNGFIKQEDDGHWIEVGDTLAREKVGQLFRNALSTQYKSSTNSKKRRRNETSSKVEAALHDIMASNEDVKETTEFMTVFAARLKISDEEVVEEFSKRNSFLLEAVIKPNKQLVQEFHKTVNDMSSTNVFTSNEE